MPNTRPTILFVDDEIHIVQLLETMFESEFRVLKTTSAAEALRLVESQAPVHVVVSDQRMPEMPGIELLTQVAKRSPATMRVLLTGYSDLAAMIGSINDGEVYRFVNKPWNNEELRQILRDASQVAQATFSLPSYGQLKAAPAGPMQAQAMPSGHPGLLIIGEPDNTNVWFREHFRNDWPVHCVPDIHAAVSVLEQQPIGVVLVDEKLKGEPTLGFLRTLRQMHPLIVSVVLTATADTEQVRRMINEVQVYRITFRPIRRGSIDLAIRASMRQHIRYVAEPQLAQRQTVSTQSDGRIGSMAGGLMSRLRKLQDRFTSMVP